MDYFGYTIADFIPCEFCGQRAVDINHINARGIGGDPQSKKDVIENLMGTCRKHHVEYGDKKDLKPRIIELHLLFMKTRISKPLE